MSTPANPLRIDADRLWQSLMDLARIGATPKGGVCRIALTDEDKAGRDQVVQWFQEAGLAVRIDEVGNVFGRRAGTDPQARAVATGSHIDTQPTGGKFDGNYGVMAGLEVVRTLNAQGIQTVAPLEVAFWTNEEGTRFTPVMMGSGAVAALLPVFLVRKTSARNKMVQASPWGPSWNASATAAQWPAAMCPAARLPPTLKRTSNKVRCWRPTTNRLAWSAAPWASSGTT